MGHLHEHESIPKLGESEGKLPRENFEIRVPQMSGNAVGVQKQWGFFVSVSSSGRGDGNF